MKNESRLSLKDWFRYNTVGPLVTGNFIVVLVGTLLIGGIVRSDLISRQTAVEDFLQVAPRPIAQKNRPMLEALLLTFAQRVQATALGICHDNVEVLSLKSQSTFCRNGEIDSPPLFRVQTHEIPGQSGFSVFLVVPLLPHLFEIAIITLSAISMIFLNLLLMRRLSRAIWADLVEPLHGTSLKNVQIAEVHDLLLTKEQAVADEVTKRISLQVAHDIRSPLSALKILVQKAKGLESGQREMLSSVCSRITGIADDLLNSRRNPEEKTLEPIAINEAVSAILKEKSFELSGHSPSSKINHVTRSENLVGLARLDDFKRLISNLINNSIEASPAKEPIQIESWAEDKSIFIAIKDRGTGISSEVMSSLGKRRITTKASGNGLGVSHALNTAASWGADLSYESTQGQGTTVTLRLNRE